MLSESEIKQAEKWAENYEKFSGFWPWFRWLVVFVCILIFIGNYYSYQTIVSVKEQNVSTNLPTGWLVSEKATEKYIDTRLSLFRREMDLNFNLYVLLITSLIVFTSILGNWNKHKDLKIIAKLLRGLLSEQSQNNSNKAVK